MRESKVFFPASYTVEAACVMAVVLLSLAFLIGRAGSLYRRETGIMRLHHMVELSRGQEEETRFDFASAGAEGYSRREGRKAEGAVTGHNWRKEISADVHEPETFLRMMTIFQKDGSREEGYGDAQGFGNQLPPGNETELSDDSG